MTETLQVLSNQALVEMAGLGPVALSRPLDDVVASLETPKPYVDFVVRFHHDLELAMEGPVAERDQKNALIMSRVLPDMSGLMATDHRLWVTLAFREYREYMRDRHPVKADDMEAVAKSFTTKYFINSSRNLIRDHGISRLWWMGRFAQRLDPVNPERVLQIFLKTVDNASQFWGRPSISAAPKLATAIYKVLDGQGYADEDTKDEFSAFMIDIDRFAGRRVLAYLDPDEIHDEITALYLLHLKR
jgi:hypothetical protein